MIDHISFAVNDYKKSQHFYDETLAVLGYERVMTLDEFNCALYGKKGGKPYFMISDAGSQEELIGKARGFHVAFIAPNRQTVDEWYQKSLELGGIDNGKPGLRLDYHPNYYAAFIIDPDGWRLEAVCHHQ